MVGFSWEGPMTGCENDFIFTIMSFNLRFALANDGENSWEKRSGIVSRVLKRDLPDFLGVQEANHIQARFLADNFTSHRHIGWHHRSEKRWQSNMIFYHHSWRCTDDYHWFLSETPETKSIMKGAKWPRQCVIGRFEKQGKQLVVVNTHFDFDQMVQEKSAKLILELLKQFPFDLPVVITGDFNADPQSPAWQIFLNNGFDEVCNGHYATTFHGFDGRASGRHIDWILFRNNIIRSAHKVIQYNEAGRYPSDHFPVWAKLLFV